MKSYLTTLCVAAFSLNISCGSSSNANQTGDSEISQEKSVNKSDEPVKSQSYGSLLVEGSKDLPSCNAEKNGSLAYVKSEEKFYVCSGEWTTISIKGEKGDPGVAGSDASGIIKTQIINLDQTNYCNEFYTIERCGFLGGQLVRFADGNILVSVSWQYFAYSSISKDSDFDIATKTFVIPKDANIMYAMLHSMVARGDGYKGVFLIYYRDSDSFILLYDDNESGAPDRSDVLLNTVRVSEF
jgi:hypothetical protein